MHESYEGLLERIEEDAARRDLGDLRLAREEFHDLTGKVEEGQPWFDIRMTMFLEWYLLDRRGPDGLTPAERFLAANAERLAPEEREAYLHLTATSRSVFRIAAIRGSDLLLDDLGGGGRWLAHWPLPMVGLSAGIVMGARIVMWEGRPTVGKGVVLHPGEAHEAIEAMVARARAEGMPPRELVDHLDKMRLKLDHYANVRIRHVYQYPGDALL